MTFIGIDDDMYYMNKTSKAVLAHNEGKRVRNANQLLRSLRNINPAALSDDLIDELHV